MSLYSIFAADLLKISYSLGVWVDHVAYAGFVLGGPSCGVTNSAAVPLICGAFLDVTFFLVAA